MPDGIDSDHFLKENSLPPEYTCSHMSNFEGAKETN
jgi:hypothetical protein